MTEKIRTRHRVASRLAVDLSQIACRNGAIIVPIITTRNKEEHSMMGVIVLGLAFGFFALAIGYARACEPL
jgi:hypothetical protein